MPRIQVATRKPAFRRRLMCLFLAASTVIAGASVTVRLQPGQPGAVIPPDFVGLSFEMQRVLAERNGNHFFSPANQKLIATFKMLGIKNLRVGGNTADRPTLPTPSQSDVDALFTFAKAAEVKVIYTLRLNQGSHDEAVKMANYISRHYPQQLDCFAIGNEPNVFSKDYAPYLAEWKIFAAEITAPTNSPGAKFCGPSVSPGHEKWSAYFANDLAHSGLLKFISQHDYPGGDARKYTNNAIGAREKILSPAMVEHYATFAANFVPTVVSNGLPWRFEEANSFYDGGALDASDTFAAALWALHYQWWWAAHGMSGINFHTGDTVAARDENKPCRYASFWTVPHGFNVHPIGYAEKMFSLGGRGRILPTTMNNADQLNLAVFATAFHDNIYVTLINREHGATAHGAEVFLDPNCAATRAQVMFLTVPNGDVAAKTGITLGGAEIQDDATWKGTWTALPRPSADGKFSLKLPTASAALVKIQMKSQLK